MFLGDLVWRITCQRLTNDRIVRCIIAYQFCIDDCVSVIFVLCLDNFVLRFGNFMLCLDNIVLCLDNIVFCFDNFVLCLDNIVLRFDNFVLCLDNIVLCFDNFVLCFKNIVLCFKNCLLCLQIWATAQESRLILTLSIGRPCYPANVDENQDTCFIIQFLL